MRAARRPTRKRQAGFTLIESLVVVAVIGILVLISAPAFLKMMNRFKLTGTTRELTSLMQAARQEAIKLNAPAHVNYDATSNSFFAFVDLDRDEVLSTPDRVLAARTIIPRKVEFWGPGDGGANGTNAIAGWDESTPTARLGPIFNPDGSVDRVGAFRLKDSNDNFLEIRVHMPATGRMILRKWFPSESAFFMNGEKIGSVSHTWVWN